MMFARRATSPTENKKGTINMRTYEFQVTGQDRKNLVATLSEILNISSKYLGVPGFKYQVGDCIIDKNGTVTGELEQEVLEALVPLSL